MILDVTIPNELIAFVVMALCGSVVAFLSIKYGYKEQPFVVKMNTDYSHSKAAFIRPYRKARGVRL